MFIENWLHQNRAEPKGGELLDNHWLTTVETTIQLRTGCSEREKIAAQAVEVRADLWAPVDAVPNPHSIEHVVNYRTVLTAIRELENGQHHECLETSILRLMTSLFVIPAVAIAAVSMRKPHVYSGQAVPTIALTLTRANWDRMNW
jgi:dihydroneopterin aldolase